MNKEVSEEDILTLHQFCKRHSVNYYDVRLELVDHLASSIEAMWEEEESIPFWDALNKIYLGYGATGFRALVREKEAAVEKAFHKGMRGALAAMFHWPNILLFLVLVMLSYFFYGFYAQGNALVPSYFISLFGSLVFILDISLGLSFILKRKKLKHKLICTNIYEGFLTSTIAFQLIITGPPLLSFLLEQGASAYSRFQFIGYTVLCIAFSLIMVAKYKFTSGIFSKAQLTYPLAFK